jgi:DNA-binding PadR family transcriptional regulator
MPGSNDHNSTEPEAALHDVLDICRSLLHSVRVTLPSRKETTALALLRDHGELYGLQLVDLSGGDLGRGSVYVMLDRMEAKGFVQSRREPAPKREGGLPRRLYKLTGLGARSLAAAEMAVRIIWAPILGGAKP